MINIIAIFLLAAVAIFFGVRAANEEPEYATPSDKVQYRCETYEGRVYKVIDGKGKCVVIKLPAPKP